MNLDQRKITSSSCQQCMYIGTNLCRTAVRFADRNSAPAWPHFILCMCIAPSSLNPDIHWVCVLLQYFYEEQLHRMECLAQEPVLFEDVLCQLHDMIQPEREGSFMLRDLKRCRSLAGTLFNILFNLNKFIAFETRDPFVIRQVRP